MPKQLFIILGVLCLLSTSLPPHAFCMEVSKLLASDGRSGDSFGRSVDVSQGTAIVGAVFNGVAERDSGSAYLFDVTSGIQVAKLFANDGQRDDWFGFSAGISGRTAIVGSPFDDDNGANSGSSYLFDTQSGLQLAKLLPRDGQGLDRFGSSVGIDQEVAIVGAYDDDDNGPGSGSAYIFDVRTGLQTTKLLPADGTRDAWFGFSVAVSGDRVIVGAPGEQTDTIDSTSRGAIYLFDSQTGSQLAKLIPEDSFIGDSFGYSVAIEGSTAVVGAPFDEQSGHAGSAYLFDIITGEQVAKLKPNDVEPGDHFGFSVDVSGGTVIVGADSASPNGQHSGSAYFFDATTGAQIGSILPGDGSRGDQFGISVSISEDLVVVGAYNDDDRGSRSGSAYVFVIPEPSAATLSIIPFAAYLMPSLRRCSRDV